MEDMPDLHEEFLKELHVKIPRKDLTSRVADLLGIDNDPAYRRVAGKVRFTTREIGTLSDKLGISLDRFILQNDDRLTWLPFILQFPLKTDSMNSLFDVIESSLDMLENLQGNDDRHVEMGAVCYSFEIELCFYSPVLLKFMLFKWGHNFVGTEEFNHYADWKVPDRIHLIFERMKDIYRFEKIYYIWDSSMIWTLTHEIMNLHTMGILTTAEKDEIRDALKDIMRKSEQTLNGTYIPAFGKYDNIDFYVCPQYLGFTGYYCVCGERHFASFQTNFNFCMVNNDIGTFLKIKSWIDSFKARSTKLSGSGRVERKLFFDSQQKIIDHVLGV